LLGCNISSLVVVVDKTASINEAWADCFPWAMEMEGLRASDLAIQELDDIGTNLIQLLFALSHEQVASALP
jgi:hypothetical protein